MLTVEKWSRRPLRMGSEVMLLSPLQVMRSAAGYYVGQAALVFEISKGKVLDGGYPAPFERHSGYFGTLERAREELQSMQDSSAEDESAYFPQGHCPTASEVESLLRAEQEAGVELDAGMMPG